VKAATAPIEEATTAEKVAIALNCIAKDKLIANNCVDFTCYWSVSIPEETDNGLLT
jgi:hypothetical protein